jgi:hypothetical protein
MAEEYKFPDEKDIVDEVEIEESDVEIEVVDDTPEPDRDRRPLERDVEDPTEDEIAEYSGKVKNRIRELTHSRHDERRAKEAAVREKEEAIALAQRLIEENKKLRGTLSTGSKEYAEAVQSKAELELEMARRKLREAQESYDTDAILQAQEGLTDAKLRQQQANYLASSSLQRQEEEVYSEPVTPRVPEPDQRALRWQQQNQWFGQDDEMTSLALAVHKKLVESGADPRSDEYYERIDARMREVFPSFFGATRQSSSKRQATVVAPATRTAGKKVVSLTKTQESLAKRLGLTKEQYAREILKLSSEA